MPDWSNVRDGLISVVLAYIILTFCPKCASAQIGAQIVSDPPVEQATADMDTVQFPALIQQDTTTATSVTTGEGGGNFTPINNYNGQLNNQLFSNINSTDFPTDFPGWQHLPNNTSLFAQQITTDVLATYANAIAIAQSQSNVLLSDNLQAIEQVSIGTTSLLAAVQANTDAALAVAQGIQAVRQLLATLVTVEATKAAQELSATAQEQATSQDESLPMFDGAQ